MDREVVQKMDVEEQGRYMPSVDDLFNLMSSSISVYQNYFQLIQNGQVGTTTEKFRVETEKVKEFLDLLV